MRTFNTAHPIPTPVLMRAEGATKNAAPDAILANNDPPSAAPILPYDIDKGSRQPLVSHS